LTVGNFGNELIEIIHSADSQVASFAIDIVTEKHWFELMPAIIKGLKKGAYFYHTKLAVLAMGEKAIPILMQNLQEETDNAKVVQLVKILAIIPSHKTEPHLLELAKGGNVVSRNSLAKALAIFALHFNFRPDFLRKLEKIALNEIKFITQLKEIAKNEQRQFVINEIIARITMLQTRFLYWFAILTKPAEIVPLISIILVSSRLEKAKAVEVLLTVSDKAEWGDAIENIFFNDADMNIEQPTMPIQECQDPWLVRVINYPNDLVPGITMDNMQKVFTLSAVELYAEVLFPLAQQTQLIDLVRDKIIFSQGDKANGLYIIVSGEVTIFRDDKEVAVLHENDFFGELGLLDEAPRSATAIGKTDGVLMFLDKNSFEALTDDFPEVLRAVMQVVLKYLRSYMGK
jgi:CRP-like cAMP-binding protein